MNDYFFKKERNVPKSVCKHAIQAHCREKVNMSIESHKGTCSHVNLGVRQVLSDTKSRGMMYIQVLKDVYCFPIAGQMRKMKKKIWY